MGVAVTKIFCINFWLTYHKESSHEIWVQLGQWFVRRLCFNILLDSKLSDLGWKVNLDLWNVFIAIASLGLTYEVRIMTFALTVIKKINFSKKNHLNALGSIFWPWRKVGQGQHRIIIWTNSVGPTSPMLHTKSKGHRLSGSGEEDFKGLVFFFSYMACQPSWSCNQVHLNKLWFPHPKESPYEIWIQLSQWFQRRRCLKMLKGDGRTDDGRRRTGIRLAHPWAFGSRELK